MVKQKIVYLNIPFHFFAFVTWAGMAGSIHIEDKAYNNSNIKHIPFYF